MLYRDLTLSVGTQRAMLEALGYFFFRNIFWITGVVWYAVKQIL